MSSMLLTQIQVVRAFWEGLDKSALPCVDSDINDMFLFVCALSRPGFQKWAPSHAKAILIENDMMYLNV